MHNELTNLDYMINHKSSKFTEINSNNIYHVCSKSFHYFAIESILWFSMPNGKEVIVHYDCGESLENRLSKNKQRLTPISETKRMNLNELRRYIFGHNE